MQQISFVTNTGADTLEYTKLLLESLKTNLVGKEHEIIVFIDKDTDGTYEYLKSIKNDFYDLKIVTHKLKGPVGYQANSNLLVDIAKHDIVSYLQSDMIIGPDYDVNVLSELEDNCILSSTRVEPPLHGYSDYTITYDFGTDPTVFDMDKWNNYSKIVKTSQAAEYFFAPITFYKKVWQSIGGYDTIFRRSREDSDFVQRCVHAGIKMIQTWQANVYHFTCVSSRGKNWFDENNQKAKDRVELQKIADGIEIRRFLKKWGGFNHGEQKLKKMDIDLVIKDDRQLNPLFVAQLEVYSSRVWLRSQDYINTMMQTFSNEQDPANQLLGYEKEGWEEAKHLFRTTNFQDIYRVGEPIDFNVKIEIDFTNVDPAQDEFIQNVTRLGDIIEAQEPGIYELGSAKIEIRNIVDLAKNQIIIQNPQFDYSLLTIE
jgi:glycosyltransferase involved in cell wall biosynthesis